MANNQFNSLTRL